MTQETDLFYQSESLLVRIYMLASNGSALLRKDIRDASRDECDVKFY